MFGERWWTRQKLFEGGSVFLVFDLLCFVTGIEIVLKLAPEIDLFESIALRFVSAAVLRNSFFVVRRRHGLAAIHLAIGGGQARQNFRIARAVCCGTAGFRSSFFKRV